MSSTSSGEPSDSTTVSPSTGRHSYDMTQLWIWLSVAVVVFLFLYKFCLWCAEQNRELAPARSLSTVAIIDAAAPLSMTCPSRDSSEHRTEEPPSYGSLPPAYNEDPPPPYSSLILQDLPTREQDLATPENHIDDSARTLHM